MNYRAVSPSQRPRPGTVAKVYGCMNQHTGPHDGLAPSIYQMNTGM